MGRCQTETYYRTETSYLKSVLLWLQEYWTGPAVRVMRLGRGRSLRAFRHRRDVDNRSACVPASPTLIGQRKTLMIKIPTEERHYGSMTARLPNMP